MRKENLIRENERLRCRIKELENIICPAEQHDWHEVRSWFEPAYEIDYRGFELKTCKELVCKKCFARKVVKRL